MKVFINKRIPEIGIKMLKDAGLEVTISENPELTQEEWLKYCKDADVILNVGQNKYDKDFFEEFPNIKAIALYSVGFDHVDIDEANQRKIPVGNTPEVLSRATSDVAFLLMQSVARRASYYFQKVKNGDWGEFDPLHELGQELYGKTLGVFGLGRIGFEMAEKCKKAFDMNIIYHNRSHNEEAEKELGAKYVSFEELVSESDVLSIHANFSEEHSEIFNESAFKKMKSNAIFINTARGGFHHQKDLYNALVSEKIWGAGLDVTNPEPIEENDPILKLSNVCVLPHIGSATIEARNGMAKVAAENIIAFYKGEKMPNCANPEVYKE
ncbi:Glyoxylate/hydroxypyruvate reductase B [Chryseobacterium aquaeductus]|uniref:Glyoxylate/hydroxypyruvate reductase B n=1 Tax=Chryseobacterium aquaeductus TaxID=2675056 RepID=A0A9N8MPS5_9FLAO|nr:D-glycerate dehydrogenase [Chryseobacterium aquaeductus]CAA7331807.1 Glyoxylate/hydroxypyruvate reductase B [Chryseobacterium potabilaquae]CAD7812508.1 Glyoxylate/hydroxypyruvate reductase B [Chryseobacterium aquaeductus]